MFSCFTGIYGVGIMIVLYNPSLIFLSILVLAHIFSFFRKTAAALPILTLTSTSVQPSFIIILPRYTKLFTSSTGCPPTVVALKPFPDSPISNTLAFSRPIRSPILSATSGKLFVSCCSPSPWPANSAISSTKSKSANSCGCYCFHCLLYCLILISLHEECSHCSQSKKSLSGRC